jgi:hypothetical protein
MNYELPLAILFSEDARNLRFFTADHAFTIPSPTFLYKLNFGARWASMVFGE